MVGLCSSGLREPRSSARCEAELRSREAPPARARSPGEGPEGTEGTGPGGEGRGKEEGGERAAAAPESLSRKLLFWVTEGP